LTLWRWTLTFCCLRGRSDRPTRRSQLHPQVERAVLRLRNSG
jgi:hypothetical protein